ncbi:MULTISPECIES: flagellar hook protein FlgE [Halomonadaceae]|uniref:flagellar hook protein FlgE n=1 Tax=Halomonadaceae TaxID=28256 RepID=UPI0015995D67|nr:MULTISPECIES: flagellar hook protein FlgE [Halomonas]QJQ94416.1 flagellar hook protein FlgE [Halomonas sp. PA5]
MSFSQALSGLNASATKLGAIGNNIANSQTVGFKSSSVQFADVYANSRIGLGTQVAGVQQNFNAGNIEATSRNLDLAIAGDGFFRFQQPNGEVVYSRNGQLTMTAAGALINSQGANIMGYPADADGNIQVGGAPVALSVPADDIPAQATNQVDIGMNLNAGEAIIDRAATQFDMGNPASYSYATNATVYDSLGNARNMTLYFTKVSEAANGSAWEVQAKLAGVDEPIQVTQNEDLTTTPPTAASLLTFDTSGSLSGADNFDVVFDDLPGAAPLAFNLDLSGATQFANTSTVSSLTQDGYTSGALVGITIENDGTVMRNYSNEQSLAAGQIVLANFRNPEGLTPVGDNAWVATAASGQELVGAPGTGLLGGLQAGALESSNVDMSQELVDMIVAQRAYQANSQTIKTQDELLQTAINLR